MTEKIIYVAIDGKEFENEHECIKYENSLKLNNLCKSTIFLDEEFKIMDIRTLDAQQIFYIYVNEGKDKKLINEIFDNDLCSSLFSTLYRQCEDLSAYSGWFYFDIDSGQWLHFETETKIFKNMEDNFSKRMLDKGLKM